ncbi:hypothetical protein SDJN03_29244, partial [Cucurbita argyrosperma subsp. sororia]
MLRFPYEKKRESQVVVCELLLLSQTGSSEHGSSVFKLFGSLTFPGAGEFVWEFKRFTTEPYNIDLTGLSFNSMGFVLGLVYSARDYLCCIDVACFFWVYSLLVDEVLASSSSYRCLLCNQYESY